jgi:hypothetical protein
MSDYISDRKTVSCILRNVMVGRCSVRQALLSYPKDSEDESLIAAYHALVHYEADEDLRARDILYREEQDEYIEFLASILERGENIPENIIENYKKYYDSAPILHEENPKGFMKGFWKNLNVGFRKEDK